MTAHMDQGDQAPKRDAKEVLQVLFEISQTIASTQDLEKIYQAVQDSLGKIFDLKHARLILCDPESDAGFVPYTLDHRTKALEQDAYLSETLELSRTVISKKEPVIFFEKQIKKTLVSQEKKTIKSKSKVWMGAPLQMGEKIAGVLAVSSPYSADDYQVSDLNLLNMVAQYVAAAIARKQSEQIFFEQDQIVKRILEATPVGIALVQNRVFKWVNDEMVSMFGYDSKPALEDQSVRMIYCCQRDYELAGKMIFYGLSSSGQAEYEINLVKKDTTQFPCLIRLNSEDQSNPMAWTIATFFDLSAGKTAHKMKIEKEKLKGVLEIAEHVSHEMDQPLRQILEFISQVNDQDALTLDQINTIRSKALEIGKITKRLTDITHKHPIGVNSARLTLSVKEQESTEE